MVCNETRLADLILDAISDAGVNVVAYKSRNDPDWLELIADDPTTGERFRVESEDVLSGAVELATLCGFDLDETLFFDTPIGVSE